MAPSADDWPALQEELSRKAIETVQDRLVRTAEGELGEKELVAAVNAIVDCISGLVPNEVLDVVYAVRKEITK